MNKKQTASNMGIISALAIGGATLVGCVAQEAPTPEEPERTAASTSALSACPSTPEAAAAGQLAANRAFAYVMGNNSALPPSYDIRDPRYDAARELACDSLRTYLGYMRSMKRNANAVTTLSEETICGRAAHVVTVTCEDPLGRGRCFNFATGNADALNGWADACLGPGAGSFLALASDLSSFSLDPGPAHLSAGQSLTSVGSSAAATYEAPLPDTGGATTAYRFPPKTTGWGSAPACGTAKGGEPCSTAVVTSPTTQITGKVDKGSYLGVDKCRCE